MRIENIQKLTDFETIPFDELQDKYSLMNITNDLYDDDDVFGYEPSLFYYKGDVHITEDLIIDNPEDLNYYIIDGTLKVDGLFAINGNMDYNVLLITGQLKAKNLLLFSEAFISVMQATQIQEMVYNDISDGGACVFHQGLTAKRIIQGTYAEFEFCREKDEEAVEIQVAKNVIGELRGENPNKIIDAVAAGKTIYKQ